MSIWKVVVIPPSDPSYLKATCTLLDKQESKVAELETLKNNNKNASLKNFLLVSSPVKEFMNAFTEIISKENVIPNRIDIKAIKAMDFEIILSNTSNEKLIIGYHADKKQFFIDRTKAGVSNFNDGFAAVAVAPPPEKLRLPDLAPTAWGLNRT